MIFNNRSNWFTVKISSLQSWTLLFVSLLCVVGVLLGYRLITGHGGAFTIADTFFKWLFSGFAILLQEGEYSQKSLPQTLSEIQHDLLVVSYSKMSFIKNLESNSVRMNRCESEWLHINHHAMMAVTPSSNVLLWHHHGNDSILQHSVLINPQPRLRNRRNFGSSAS